MSTDQKENKGLPILFFLILIGAAFLRLTNLGTENFWADEDTLIFVALESPQEIISRKYQVNIVDKEPPDAPLTPLFLHAWAGRWVEKSNIQLTGPFRFWVRLPFALAGIAAVVLVYLLGRLFLSRPESYVAMALAAFMINPIYYARDARPYSWLALFALAAFYFLARASLRPSVLSFLGFGLSLALGLYSHYFFPFVMILAPLWAFLFYRTAKAEDPARAKKFALGSTLGITFACLAFAPWVPALLHVVDQSIYGGPTPSIEAVPSLGYHLEFFAHLITKWTTGHSMVWLIFALVIYGGLQIFKIGGFGPAVLSWLLLPWLILIFMPGSQNLHYRYLHFQYPALYFLVAVGWFGLVGWAKNRFAWKWSSWVVGGLLALFLFAPSLGRWDAFYDEPFKCVGGETCEEELCHLFVQRCPEHEFTRIPVIKMLLP